LNPLLRADPSLAIPRLARSRPVGCKPAAEHVAGLQHAGAGVGWAVERGWEVLLESERQTSGEVLSEQIRYRLLDHVADLGVEIWAPTLEDLFVEGARALFDLIGTLDATRGRIAETIVIKGEDIEDLLRAWLSEILFRCVAQGKVFCDFQVLSLDSQRVKARARGEPFDPARHSFEREIKAVTYHGLEVRQGPEGWRAAVILDV
jgi:SHS2 domain-containing protein